MNYFSKIKPVLNKLSELNVYDSLEMVRAYMQASAKVTGSLSRGYKYPRYAESDRGLNLSGFFIRISVESLFFITIEVR